MCHGMCTSQRTPNDLCIILNLIQTLYSIMLKNCLLYSMNKKAHKNGVFIINPLSAKLIFVRIEKFCMKSFVSIYSHL